MFMTQNFKIGWLDMLFPYHVYSGGQIALQQPDGKQAEDSDDTINATLKFYHRQKAMYVWLHHKKFDGLLSDDDKQHLAICEQKMTAYNLGFKGLALFMFMQVRLLRRPAGRMLVYEAGLLYGGSYAFLLSQIAGIRAVFDPKVDSMCQRMLRSGRRVDPDQQLEFTALEDWKCYLYHCDLMFGSYVMSSI